VACWQSRAFQRAVRGIVPGGRQCSRREKRLEREAAGERNRDGTRPLAKKAYKNVITTHGSARQSNLCKGGDQEDGEKVEGGRWKVEEQVKASGNEEGPFTLART
jgi:hypothetical protein